MATIRNQTMTTLDLGSGSGSVRRDLLNLRSDIERKQRDTTNEEDVTIHMYHNIIINDVFCVSLMTYDTPYVIKTYRRILNNNYVIYIIDDVTNRRQKISVYNRDNAKMATRQYSTNYTVHHDGYTLITDKATYNRIKAQQEKTHIEQVKRLTVRTYSANPIYDKAYSLLAQACVAINDTEYMTITDCDIIARAITKRISGFAKIELPMIVNTVVDYMSTHKHGTIKVCRKIMGFRVQTLEKNHRDIDSQLRLWETMAEKINKNDRKAKSEISALSLDNLADNGYEPTTENIGCLGVSDIRLIDLMYYIRLNGDMERYHGYKIATASDSRFLKSRMQTLLDKLGFTEATATAKSYVDLCNLAYLRYSA